MRDNLAAMDGIRTQFRAVFVRLSSRPVWRNMREPVFLLWQIQLIDGGDVAEHLWCNLTAGFAALDPQPGDVLEFTARVRPYHKHIIRWRHGRLEGPIDWHLAYPTRIVKVGSGTDLQACGLAAGADQAQLRKVLDPFLSAHPAPAVALC
jgi:hypothetical protein